jgi:signal transduction histidine kinase
MRERVEHLGGEFNIVSAQGEGTVVRLRIPLGKSPRH